MVRILQAFIIISLLIRIGFAQNPKIKVNYFVQDGKMISSLGVNAGACIERLIPGLGGNPTTTSNLEIRIHSILKSSSGPTAAILNSCTGATASGGAGVPGWSCENRCETASNAGRCDQWVPNGSQNASYPGNPNYTDTSSYPCTDILSYRLKGFESDATSSTNLQDQNFNDGACAGSCTLASCYGNYQTPTSGDNDVPINIGQVGDTLRPFLGGVWSKLYQTNLETAVCTTDGFTNYYYSRWKYRWCWDSTTINSSHAGLIKTPSVTEICSASNYTISDSSQAYEATRGFSEYQWQSSINGTTWSNITASTAKDLSTSALVNNNTDNSTITYLVRRVALFCIDFVISPVGKKSVYSNLQSVVVYPQPNAPTLFAAGTSPANGTTICKGLFVYAQFNPGNGGYTNATDEFQYSINGGSTWTNYTPGASINTATATTSVQVRVRRVAGSLLACNTTAWSTLVTWPVSSIATPATPNIVTPSNNSAICLGANTSSTFNAGSGSGTGDEFQYSINNGSSWSVYTPGNIINTTTATTKVIIQTRRTGIASGTCFPTPWATAVEWNVVAQPIAPSYNSHFPVGTVNIGDTVRMLANGGSGGAVDAKDSMRISFDNGITWTSYVNNSQVQIPSGSWDKIIIQSARLSGSSTGCNSLLWSNLGTWNLNSVLPVELTKFYISKYENYNDLHWTTLSEYNTKEFVIEKSKNAIDWLPTGNINAVGFSNLLNNYTFSDYNVQNTSYYYRLKIIDFDNAFEYSSVIFQPRNMNKFEFNVYPNPTNGNLNIQFYADQNKKSDLVVKNLLGQIVKTIHINVVNQNNLISIDCSDLSNGTYFINFLDQKEINHVIKFLKY